MRIATLTLNPAIDVSTAADRVEPDRKLRCEAGRRDPGGGGINVARAARRLGADVVAIYPVAGFSGRLLEALVEGEGVPSRTIPVAGETREDFTVLDRSIDRQFRFVLPGPTLDEAGWRACLDGIDGLAPAAGIVCASGSLPPGAHADAYAELARRVAARGARLALDTSGKGLRRALEAGVWLVKPNLREMAEATGLSLESPAGRVAACRALIARGAAEVVALTLGAEGSLLVTARDAWRAAPLPVHAVSTVGAGDSFLGALIWAVADGRPLDEAFRWAVAGGTAAVLAAGTQLAHADDVRRLFAQVSVAPAAP